MFIGDNKMSFYLFYLYIFKTIISHPLINALAHRTCIAKLK